jgi:hypothetical protein
MAIAISQNGNSIYIADVPAVEIPCNSASASFFGTSSIQIISNEVSGLVLYTFNWNSVTIASVSPTSQLDALAKISALLFNNMT